MKTCVRCHRTLDELVPVPGHLLALDGAPAWQAGDMLCHNCLRTTRHELITAMLAKHTEIKRLEAEVVQSIVDHKWVSTTPEDPPETLNWGDRVSDNIAKFGGSWRFIISFLLIMMGWITFNALIAKPFDPFPFILLNLALSCLAALQAPVIMMSQNRQEERDRKRSVNDYQINLKAELEIRQLHLKLDHLLYHQWQQLYALQELQVDLLEEILEQSPDLEPPLDPSNSGPDTAIAP
jgi:uncharacterized membrane protein